MRVAIVQLAPVHFDLPACIKKASKAISEAASKGADLIVFGETWFSGYPVWIDYSPEVAFWDHKPTKKVFAKMLSNSLQVESSEMDHLAEMAKSNKISLVFGANEVDPAHTKGTIYNSLFFINEKGKLVNHHRKLVPTFTEKMLYGHGDGHGLVKSRLNGVSVTGSVCWEHWMPMTRQALHDTGEEIHVAAWPKVHEMHQIASRQYAFEGRCFVLAAGQMFHSNSFPAELKKPDDLSDGWLLNGGSCVIGPDGQYVVEPVWDEERIIYAEIDLDRVKEESMTLDVSGHYQRPDVFDFIVRKDRKK